jgi:hypothetical protein
MYSNPVIETAQRSARASRSRRASLAALIDELAGAGLNGPQGDVRRGGVPSVGGGSAGLPAAGTRGGGMDAWISQALRYVGQPDSRALHDAVRILVQHESGGNPRAVNRWDSNARAGHPSQGLAQTIPGTFAAWRDPRLSADIFDPVANLVAGLRYGANRYGSITSIPGIAAVLRGGRYRGY